MGSNMNMADYMFVKKGSGWLARFAGRELFTLLPSKGALYLSFLFSRPYQKFSVVELLHCSQDRRTAIPSSGIDGIIDREAICEYEKRSKELFEMLEIAKAENNYHKQEEIQLEMDWLTRELKNSRRRSGRIRKEINDVDRIRRGVQMAIKRVICEIEQFDRIFAQHLSHPVLICGFNPCYYPVNDICWET